ncbi:cyanate lyase [Microbacterium foliorum]|uniref:cyanase n=1 Tax=Microbacterium foliorum TaxID=104336 RepID=UPI00209DCCFC|nr:cyanase [Microbacterium foliorum]MCP1428211.1 cyanate lyase [Microbacterium foliorum]
MLHAQTDPTARHDRATAAKISRDLTWVEIAAAAELSPAFTTAAVLGQHPLPRASAEAVGTLLGLDDDDIVLMQTIPVRGAVGIPTDPTMYRFYEMVNVYAPTLKELVHEMFGDGIISAINFTLDVAKVDDPDGGHRAVITLNGKYLPTKPF